jgi:AraC-like DNA-binding protein
MAFSVLTSRPEPEAIRTAFEASPGLRFRLEFANRFHGKRSWRLRHRRIPLFHTVFCFDGRGRYEIAGEGVALEAGTLLVVGPGVEHSSRIDPQARPHLATARFFPEAPQAGRTFPDAIWWAISAESIRRYEGIYLSMVEAWRRRENPLRAQAADEFLNGLLRESVAELTRGARGDPAVAGAVRHLDEHPEDPRTVEALAREAGLSVRSFSERFARATGETPGVYRNRRRGQAACELLLDTDLRVKEIAAALGYPDPSAFSRQFSRLYGVSPSRFRRERHGGERARPGTDTLFP